LYWTEGWANRVSLVLCMSLFNGLMPPKEEAKWELYDDIANRFPQFQLEA